MQQTCHHGIQGTTETFANTFRGHPGRGLILFAACFEYFKSFKYCVLCILNQTQFYWGVMFGHARSFPPVTTGSLCTGDNTRHFMYEYVQDCMCSLFHLGGPLLGKIKLKCQHSEISG